MGLDAESASYSICQKNQKKYGIKLRVLCEAESGYCCKFQIYTGKQAQEKGLAYWVVFELMKPFLDKNHHLFIDNFYSTVKLFQDPEIENIYACGTIHKDQGNFLPEFHRDLERGQSIYLWSGNLTAVHWKDKRDMYCLSTIHGTNESLIQRRAGDPITKPEIVTEYNQYMNGVDHCDQYLVSYTFL